MHYRSKTLATWLGVIAGALGAHASTCTARATPLAWLHLPPTLVGLCGAWRMHTLGQDDRLSWLLVPLLGVMLSISMLAAIVCALTPDARWDARYNPAFAPRPTRLGAGARRDRGADDRRHRADGHDRLCRPALLRVAAWKLRGPQAITTG